LSGVNETDARLAIQKLLVYSDSQQRFDLSTQLYPTLDAMLQDVKANKLHFIIMLAVDYLNNPALQKEITPILVSANGNKPGEEYILLVRKGLASADINKLRGKKLIIADGAPGTLSELWMDSLLLGKGLPESRQFFGTINRASTYSKVVLPVFFDQADACIVARDAYDTIWELNPQVQRDLRELAHSPLLITALYCVTSIVDEKSTQDIIDIALDLNKSKAGQQVLVMMRQKRLQVYRPVDLEATAGLISELERMRMK